MKIAFEPISKAGLNFPCIMVSAGGCIKLFVNPTDGVLLVGEGGAPKYALCYPGDGKEGKPILASDDYWMPFTGRITLSN